MTLQAAEDGQSAETPDHEIPRMVSLRDLELVEQISAQLKPSDTIIEFGPWLGAFSVKLAAQAQLHVVDNFIWTSLHEKKSTGVAKVGGSFRPAFEANLAANGLNATIHETDFADFIWDGPAIDLVVIDGPKTAHDLRACLRPVTASLAQTASVVIKNGLTVYLTDMTTYLEWLVDQNIFQVRMDPDEATGNVLVLTPGSAILQFDPMMDWPLANGSSAPRFDEIVPMVKDHPYRLTGLARSITARNFKSAYEILANMPEERQILAGWGKIEADLLKKGSAPDSLAWFSEIAGVHHAGLPEEVPASFHQTAFDARKGFWINNADKDWRGRNFDPEIINAAYDYGYMGWPSKVRNIVHGKEILDIGCGPGLHGLGYLAAGAASYLGVDPIIKLDKDRVKNLTAKTKAMFGWTPAEIAARIDTWEVRPIPVEEIEPDRKFDLVTLHNVTEHLHGLEGAFESAARVLRPGGKMLYNHHNFYSWNGHHLPPKTIDQIDLTDPGQLEMMDWGHVEYVPDPQHYIARGLNRVLLDEILELTEKYFDIETSEEIPSGVSTGAERLTDNVRRKFPYLEDRDFLTQNLLCIATVRK